MGSGVGSCRGLACGQAGGPLSIDWRRHLPAGAADVLVGTATALALVDLVPLHAKIGPWALAHDFLAPALTQAGLLSARP